jgi:hypothetical protein
LNIIETDFRLGKTTLFEHFYPIFAVFKRAIQPSSIFPDCTVVACDKQKTALRVFLEWKSLVVSLAWLAKAKWRLILYREMRAVM